MAVKSEKAIVEDVLKQAGSLGTQDGVANYRVEISIRRISCKHFDLPLALRIVGVTMRIDFGSQEIHAFPTTRIGAIFDIQQRRCCDCLVRLKKDFFWRFVQILHAGCILADNFEMIVIVPSIERQEESPRFWVMKQIRILVPLIRDGGDENL